MATTVPAKSFEFKGYKENFLDYIATLSPYKTPFLDCVGKDTARNYNVQWVTDHNTPIWPVDGMAPSPEGRNFLDDDGKDEALIATQQEIVSNFAQKITRRVAVSETAASVNAYGRRNEVQHQLDKAAVDMKRQLELYVLSGQTKADGTPTTGRKMGGLMTLIAAPQKITAAGATVVLDDLKKVWTSLYDADSDADVILANDQFVAAIAALKSGTGAMPALQVFKDVEITKPNGEVVKGQKEHLTITDQYGKVWIIIPCRNVPENTAYFIDPEEIDIVYFREPVVDEIDPTGSAQRYFVECEATIRLRSPNKCAVLLPKS